MKSHLALLCAALEVGAHAVALQGTPHTRSSPRELWYGTISFDDPRLKTHRAPLNVSVTTETNTASFSWFFTAEGCRNQLEPKLAWSVSRGGNAAALGCISDPCDGAANFYSFVGQASATGNTINGSVIHPPYSRRQRVGTFTICKASAVSQPLAPQCRAGRPVPGPAPSPSPPKRPVRPNPNGLWPAPAQFDRAASGGAQVVIDSAGLRLRCEGIAHACEQAQAGFQRGAAWAFSVNSNNSTDATLREIVVLITSGVDLQFGVNESYVLAVNETTAVIEAATQWGALYGLESFFQLVLIEPWQDCPTCNQYLLRELVPFVIRDEPRTRWRGLMIDTARHYLPVSLIQKTIDAMAASKMNSLHWHLTDDQSFPLCLQSQPQLCQLSAYKSHATGVMQNYSSLDVSNIVSYATARGVRVIPELVRDAFSLMQLK